MSDPDMPLPVAASIIMEGAYNANAGGTVQSQLLCVAEESGEFVKAMRRWLGMARSNGTEEEARGELADIVISAYCMAEVLEWDLDAAVQKKLEIIFSRGWKEGHA